MGSGMTLKKAVGDKKIYGHVGFIAGLSWKERFDRMHFDDVHPGIPKILQFFDEAKPEDPAKIPISLHAFEGRMRLSEAVDLQKSSGNIPISVARFFHLFEDPNLQIPSGSCSKIICPMHPYLFNVEIARGPVLYVYFEYGRRTLNVEMTASPIFPGNCCFPFTGSSN